MDFWERLDELTANSQENNRKAVAKVAGVSPSAIAMWKTRKSYPTADVAVKIAQKLGITVEYLITGECSGTIPAREVEFLQKARRWREVVERLDSLDPELATKLISFILAVPPSPMVGESLLRAEGE